MKTFSKVFNASLFLFLCVFVLSSCVPARKFEETNMAYKKCLEENEKYKADMLELETKNKDAQISISDQKKLIEQLSNDTATLSMNNRRVNTLYNELNNSYERLVANNDKLLQSNMNETKKLIVQLQQTQEELIRKEDSLAKSAARLRDKEASLNQKEKRVKELESVINALDSTVSAMKNSVSNALKGYENSGLSVVEKNGKVYVLMDEKLLFSSGSIDVDTKGAAALKELSKVLEANPDFTILVEGHTDNVPIKTACMKDNWDLSVLRSTSVTRILLSSANVSPLRVVPSGRSEYLPVDEANTTEARKKNRRIEVILSPKLDNLNKLLELK
ncbi:MAG TPA: OmpA family protein [Bacteroidia bacterium]|nr:OmpA family protein [Bacteroidia bacterium]HNT80301.1 OmpA family protein [Bacteroidia bacterium]